MTEDLRTIVVSAAAKADELSIDSRSLLYSALNSSESLASAVDAIPLTRCPAAPLDNEATAPVTQTASIFIDSFSVAGFRGIAGHVNLSLQAAPGLTLVTGRNGSGKSSLAEACELALSKSINRTAKSSSGSDGLSNLHAEGAATIAVQLETGTSDQINISTTFQHDDIANLDISARSGTQDIDLEKFGWSDAIKRYRPILSYGELSALASSKPSDLFDPINDIIGLDSLTTADQLLMKAKTEQSKISKQSAEMLKQLLSDLRELDDPRATELVQALGGKDPDLELAREIVAGIKGSSAEDRRQLQAWATQEVPDPGQASQAAEKMVAARLRMNKAVEGNSGRLSRLADMLDLAIAHREHEDDLCPVCGEGRLNEAWLTAARDRSQEARVAASEVDAAGRELDTARHTARGFVTSPPAVLGGTPVLGVDPAPAAQAWANLQKVIDPKLDSAARDLALATELPGLTKELSAEINTLRSAVSETLKVQDTAWEPVSERVGETLIVVSRGDRAKIRIAAIDAARTWLGGLTSSLRKERMEHFKSAATSIWKGLQQESNVHLEGIALTGTNTRRNVQLDLTVDGTPGPQAVLSQGELAALGLALFLPRSTAPESPFRFVLIDDPVQSMDPSKVDGLARVLHQLSQDRQIVVFTHDDRLLHALRNLSLPATVYEVVRGEKSAVEVRKLTDAVDQYLRDARALTSNVNTLPIDLVAIAVAGCCRDAIDETALELARRRLRSDGVEPSDIESRLSSARGTWERLALALCGNKNHKGSRVDAVLDSKDPEARAIISLCVDGVHEPDTDTVKSLPDRVDGLIRKLRS